MKLLTFSRTLWWTSTPVLAFLAVLQPLTAETVKITVPNQYTNQVGNLRSDVSYYGTVHQQQLYRASQFDALPETHHTLTGFYARPHATEISPSSVPYEDLILKVSTTDRESMSIYFDTNHGPDLTTVYEGPLTISTEAGGPPAGPRTFDYYFPFEVPFIYDPVAGDLLIEFISESGPVGHAVLDSYLGATTDYLISSNLSRTYGTLQEGGFVNQLVFEKTLLADFNLDLTVDGDDLFIWESAYGGPGTRETGDATGDGLVAADDFLVWQREYIAGVPGLASELGVPEPATWTLMLLSCTAWLGARSFKTNGS